MATFDFDQVEDYIQRPNSGGSKINFLGLKDNGWYANVRFMYNNSSEIKGESVHNVAQYIGANMPRYVSCLRTSIGEPIDNCPLCKAGNKVGVQFFIPVYVISIVSNLRGAQQEQPVNQVMIFQRGASIRGTIDSIKRQCPQGTPIVSSVFRLVRNGVAKDPSTNYSVEYVTTDNVTLDQLPPAPVVVGSYILPTLNADQIVEKYLSGNQQTPQDIVTPSQPAGVQPRTISANTFAGNTVVGQNQFQQAPVQQPKIDGFKPGNVPF